MGNCLRLVKPSVCPPDGFKYTFPEDGYLAHGWTYTDWVQAARNHYHANPNLTEPPDLEAQMEHQLCQTLEPGWCMYDDPNRPRVNLGIGWEDVQQGLKTFSAWAIEGRKTTTQAEANRRAEICTRCYMNVNVTGCSTCQKIVEEVVGDKKTPYDGALRNCAVCKCFLRAKVHFPIKLLLDTEREKLQSLYPEHCWLKVGGTNYVSPTDVPN